MGTEITVTRQKQTLQHFAKPSPEEERLMLVLAETATVRGATASPIYLRSMAARLSKLPFEEVMSALETISQTRQEHEAALPTLPQILRTIGDTKESLREDGFLRRKLRILFNAFGVSPSEDLFTAYWDAVGHRTDQDIDSAYHSILKNQSLHAMPTPGQFLAACGKLTVRRDGSRPE